MNKYDVIIIGTGPSGLGAAFELISKNPKFNIALFDKEKICSGGLLNDCKQNYTFPIGFTQEYWDQKSAQDYLKEVERHLEPNFLQKNNLDKYRARAKKIDVSLIDIKQAHLGTDKSVILIKNLLKKLRYTGVDLFLKCNISDLKLDRVIAENGKTYFYKKLIIAPGRKGFSFLWKVMDKLKIDYIDNVVDVGIRLETLQENYSIVGDYYDPKFYFPNKVRTFCTNSGRAFVTQEKYNNFNIVNGHSLSSEKGKNNYVNFALLKTIKLKDPVRSGQKMAVFLARLANEIGGGKPIMQRIGDFRAGKRSKKETFNDDLFYFKQTCHCTEGDLGLAVPSNIMRDIWSAIKKLDSICPGIMHPSTIMYYPEIKMYANRPKFVDKYFRVLESIYMIGDGAGTSRGITGAWASGIRAARGILKEYKI